MHYKLRYGISYLIWEDRNLATLNGRNCGTASLALYGEIKASTKILELATFVKVKKIVILGMAVVRVVPAVVVLALVLLLVLVVLVMVLALVAVLQKKSRAGKKRTPVRQYPLEENGSKGQDWQL